MEARHVDELTRTLDRLRSEVAQLRESRLRIVLAGDADRRTIERELHDGPHQHLVAIAVNLQRVADLTDSDLTAAKALLEQLERDVQEALDETAQLAQRVYPPLLEAGGLALALRTAAASAGIAASVDVSGGVGYAPEVAWTVYLCWLGALERAGSQATITVRDEDGAVAFDVTDDRAPSADGADSNSALDSLHDRVEALGGRLTIRSEPKRGIRVSGSLPVPR